MGTAQTTYLDYKTFFFFLIRSYTTTPKTFHNHSNNVFNFGFGQREAFQTNIDTVGNSHFVRSDRHDAVRNSWCLHAPHGAQRVLAYANRGLTDEQGTTAHV